MSLQVSESSLSLTHLTNTYCAVLHEAKLPYPALWWLMKGALWLGNLSLCVREIFLAPYSFGEYFFGSSYEPSMCWVLHIFLVLDGSCWYGAIMPLRGRDNIFSHSHLVAGSSEIRAPTGSLVSCRCWDGLDCFLSGRTFYSSYLTFLCTLKLENRSANRQVQVIIKNTLTVPMWVSQCLAKMKPLEGEWSPSLDLNWFSCLFCCF